MAVAEVPRAGIVGTPAVEGPQHVLSAQSFGAVALGPVSPQPIPMGIAGAAMAMPFAWLQQSIVRWLPQALWPQAFSVNVG
jgi:hypothetical protein